MAHYVESDFEEMEAGPEMDAVIRRSIFNNRPELANCHFSTEIVDAWKVAVQFFPYFNFGANSSDQRGSQWVKIMTEHGDVTAFAPRSALAICRAALMAMCRKKAVVERTEQETTPAH